MKNTVAVSLDESILDRIDRLVSENVYPDRSVAIERAVAESLERMERSRLLTELDKLDIEQEKAMAEEGMALELDQWPQY